MKKELLKAYSIEFRYAIVNGIVNILITTKSNSIC